MSVWASLRQMTFPSALRIPEPVWPMDSWSALEATVKAAIAAAPVGEAAPPVEPEPAAAPVAAEAVAPPVAAEPAAPPVGPSPPKPSDTLEVGANWLVTLATGLWRLRQKMLQPGTDRPLDEMRKPFRHLQSAWNALGEVGLETQDHTGAKFDAGQSLKVLTYQPTKGLTCEQVVDTIKPTVYLHGRVVQMGEVVVGTPERDDGAVNQTRGSKDDPEHH